MRASPMLAVPSDGGSNVASCLPSERLSSPPLGHRDDHILEVGMESTPAER
jgi:hypothetical protein